MPRGLDSSACLTCTFKTLVDRGSISGCKTVSYIEHPIDTLEHTSSYMPASSPSNSLPFAHPNSAGTTVKKAPTSPHSSPTSSSRKSDRLAEKRSRACASGRRGKKKKSKFRKVTKGARAHASSASSSSESEDEDLAGDTIVEDSQEPLDLLQIPAAAAATFEDSQDPGAMADDEETQLPFKDSLGGGKDSNGGRYTFFKTDADFEMFSPRENTEHIIQHLRRQAEWSHWVMESRTELRAEAQMADWEKGEACRLRLEAETQTKALHDELTETRSQLTEANSTIARIREAVVHEG
ncbi:hypothetical protein D9619_008413 [Psilocybe cf. subviscida]|uniref:Uncharacterized protein n=1 Tax=Psilocybe cf. subviscida TaxID=2480587 RepID=A0A8H5F0H3_9AGAR|nr:hypothetical protein D9619_008413 [Psilocybe cf. subviscida]